MMVNHVDLGKLRHEFKDYCRQRMPQELVPYQPQWDASTEYFFNWLIEFLNENNLEIAHQWRSLT